MWCYFSCLNLEINLITSYPEFKGVEISSLKQICNWQITLLTFYIPDDANFVKKQYGAVNVLLWKQKVVEGKVYILKKFFQIKQAILYQDIQSSMYMLRFLKR